MLCYQHFRIFISLDSMAAVQDVLYNQGFYHEINQGGQYKYRLAVIVLCFQLLQGQQTEKTH